ncbi:uncharacterized protein K460DRAFT_287342 [Cucurbitaria berberidis CBS 394.84]|uniref:Uncharacterized protein n=1 Tax=Cucurbitaria berberidis CBS 394.84 TaxID=1168544 RepID=A0A9P4L607_9PLEO|nr:uncharacterized protein K460DRAFT_287342 [Cucurbitaria berberidis CBS 394.84]KAF1842809.1 hypothetical protein K460DRAFT_287342 [Cucurbitaria berberidis CBS 394.84]
MLLNRILTIAAIGLTASGFVIPEGQEEGTYAVEFVDGVEVHTKLANATVYAPLPKPYASEPQPNRLIRRDYSCGGARDLHHGNTDAANADLDRQCGGGVNVNPGMNYYSIRGDIVAFFCNFSDREAKYCSAGGRQDYSREITKACGWYNSGWFTFPNQWSIGYDRGRCFCGGCA